VLSVIRIAVEGASGKPRQGGGGGLQTKAIQPKAIRGRMARRKVIGHDAFLLSACLLRAKTRAGTGCVKTHPLLDGGSTRLPRETRVYIGASPLYSICDCAGSLARFLLSESGEDVENCLSHHQKPVGIGWKNSKLPPLGWDQKK
jgi:hypothetical protein